MGSDSRYDRARPVGTAEYQQSRALHVIGELVRDYPGITNGAVAGQVARVLHAAANELQRTGIARRGEASGAGVSRRTPP